MIIQITFRVIKKKRQNYLNRKLHLFDNNLKTLLSLINKGTKVLRFFINGEKSNKNFLIICFLQQLIH